MTRKINKRKIINDPVYGFIKINFDLIYDLIEHPFFQRLRRIRQLGLTHYVYPGANHTRFQHAIGSMHLMEQAIKEIRNKENEISTNEEIAVTAAILLHDIGHGPFSHALESSIIENVDHEKLSLLIMNELNELMGGQLNDAIKIFQNNYHKHFLHELVSGQLDMDRLDYLKRDSFFTGVYEGVIGEDRIIKMLNVRDDKLVSEAKGIYSLERFLTARRLMYWQVYFHKTVISSEKLLESILLRAKYLANNGTELFATPALKYFLYTQNLKQQLSDNPQVIINNFTRLDDNDIIISAKYWSVHKDYILSELSKNLLNRKLFKVVISEKPLSEEYINNLKQKIKDKFQIKNDEDIRYFLIHDIIKNHTYTTTDENIRILMNNGQTKDLNEVSDIINLGGLTNITEKYFVCYPKELIDS